MAISKNSPIRGDCPLDGACEWKPLFRSSFKNYGLPIQRCETCGFQAQFPPPEDPAALYGESYYAGDADYSYEDERKRERNNAYVWDARLRTIRRFVRGGRFLDIGCAFGGFLKRGQAMGFEPYGVEISSYSAAVARERGITVFEGEFLDSAWSERHFSLVTMIEVIEHLAEPRRVIAELYRITAPGGLVVIQTADMDAWQAIDAGPDFHYYLPGHLSYYSAEILRKALLLQGFSRVKIFRGVDFPLMAKLRKFGGSVTNPKSWAAWFRISLYHFRSKFRRKGRPLTSSMVVYAIK